MIELCGRKVGEGQPLFLIAGPDVIESEESVLGLARTRKRISEQLNLPFVLKCSLDKANRTRGDSFRGPGLKKGLEILSRVKRAAGVPLLTDVHEVAQVGPVGEVADVLQI